MNYSLNRSESVEHFNLVSKIFILTNETTDYIQHCMRYSLRRACNFVIIKVELCVQLQCMNFVYSLQSSFAIKTGDS